MSKSLNTVAASAFVKLPPNINKNREAHRVTMEVAGKDRVVKFSHYVGRNAYAVSFNYCDHVLLIGKTPAGWVPVIIEAEDPIHDKFRTTKHVGEAKPTPKAAYLAALPMWEQYITSKQ